MLVEEYDMKFSHMKDVENIVTNDRQSRLDLHYDSKVELPERTKDEQGMFLTHCIAKLEGLDNNKQYSFNNKPYVYDMAVAFIMDFKEQETYFPIHPPLIKK
jgi:hypothetical protein